MEIEMYIYVDNNTLYKVYEDGYITKCVKLELDPQRARRLGLHKLAESLEELARMLGQDEAWECGEADTREDVQEVLDALYKLIEEVRKRYEQKLSKNFSI